MSSQNQKNPQERNSTLPVPAGPPRQSGPNAKKRPWLEPGELSALVEDFPPSAEQSEVVAAPLEAALVSAGAGSGKTFTLSARVLHLVVNEGLRPEQILGLTFTRKAAGEMNNKLNKKISLLKHKITQRHPALKHLSLADLELPIQVSTYDSFVGNVLKEFGALAGINTEYSLISAAQKIQIMQLVLDNWDGEPIIPPDRSYGNVLLGIISLADQLRSHGVNTRQAANKYDDYIEALEKLKNCLRDHFDDDAKATNKAYLARLTEIGQAQKMLFTNKNLLGAVEAYWQYKKEQNLLDFSDQTALALQLTQEIPQVAQVLRQRYRVVLLDEFQDTSVVQMEFLSGLFKGHPVTAVGDPKQAIYGWRGASANSMADFQKYFSASENDEVATYQLTQTRRNEEKILEAANYLSKTLECAHQFSGSDNSKGQILEVADSPIRTPGDRLRADLPGLVLPKETGKVPNVSLQALPEKRGGKVEVSYTLYDTQEAEVIAAYLLENFVGATVGQGDQTRPVEAAILVRNRSVLTPILAALEEQDIAYQLLGNDLIFSDRGVRLVLHALRLTDDPGRGADLAALLDMCNLDRPDMQTLANLARLAGQGQTVYSVLLKIPRWLEDGDNSQPGGPGEQSKPNLDEKLCNELHSFSAPARSSLCWLGQVLNKLVDAVHLPLPDLCERARQLLGLDLEAIAHNPQVSIGAWQGFLDLTHGFVAQAFANPSLSAFLTYLEIALEEEQGLGAMEFKADNSKVQIMTVHAAKGLEWDIVCLPGLNQGVFPKHGPASRKPGKGGAPERVNTLMDLQSNAAAAGEYLEYVEDHNNYDPVNAPWFTQFAAMPRALQKDAQHLVDYDFKTIEIPRRNWIYLWKKHPGKAQRRAGFLEEMRLAYVALTRARSQLLLSGKWLKKGGVSKQKPSPVIELLCGLGMLSQYQPGAGSVASGINTWQAQLPPDLDKTVQLRAGVWPAGTRLEQAENQHLRQLVDLFFSDESAQVGAAGVTAIPEAEENEIQQVLQQAHDLLQRQIADKSQPGHLLVPGSATEMSSFVADVHAFQRNKARPLPTRPSSYTRLGNLFHKWVQSSIDNAYPLDLGGLDDPVGAPELAAKLQQFKDNFMGMEFRNMRALATEESAVLALPLPVAKATDMDKLRQQLYFNLRYDAVLLDKHGTVWIVDWKTGRRPKRSEYAKWVHQLGLYRLHWLTKHPEIPPEKLHCAYVFVGQTDPTRQVLELSEICTELGIDTYDSLYLQKTWQEAAASLDL